MPKFPFFRQYDAMDCGPTCLRMVSKYYRILPETIVFSDGTIIYVLKKAKR